MKVIFNQNKQALPIVCISLLFGVLAVVFSLSGYIRVYLLHSASKTDAVVISTYLSDTHSKHESGDSKYVLYSFSVEDTEYTGSETCLKSYSPGEKIQIYYLPEHPEKNGLMNPKSGIFFFGIAIIVFSVSWLIWYYKSK